MPNSNIFSDTQAELINRLINENTALRKQTNDMKIQSVSEEVADHIDGWLSRPYKENKTEQQDINDFALRITKYIGYRLRV